MISTTRLLTKKLTRPTYFCSQCGPGTTCYKTSPDYKATTIVSLGRAHGFQASFSKHNGRVRLHVGCRTFSNSIQAKRHWKRGENPFGEPRPHAEKLIEAALKASKKYRLNWK